MKDGVEGGKERGEKGGRDIIPCLWVSQVFAEYISQSTGVEQPRRWGAWRLCFHLVNVQQASHRTRISQLCEVVRQGRSAQEEWMHNSRAILGTLGGSPCN